VRQLAAGHLQPDRIRPGGEEKAVEPETAAVLERDLLGDGIESGRASAEHHVDPMLFVEFRGSVRNPIRGRVPGQVVLGEVRPVVGQRLFGGDLLELAAGAFLPQNIG